MTNISVLAPNNAAYELLGSIGLNLSEMGADFTVPVLKYHFLEGIHDSSSFSKGNHATLAHTALTGLNETGSAPVKLSQRDGSHLAEGGLQLSAGVVEADIAFDGGVIHTLNSTLVAPHNISATAFMNGLFKFLKIMEESNMVGDLESIYDGTLFIPTDAAWRRYQSTMSRMTPAEVASVLSYHAIEGSVLYHSDLSEKKQEIKSKAGRSLILETDGHGDVRVNGVLAVKEDLIWYGGVAYVIDEVLTPEGKSKSSAFEPCRSWAKNMVSEHPFISSITGLSAFAIAAILLLIATTQIKRWSSVHHSMSLQLLSKSAQPCEEKGLLAED
jgi:transforming growth factor-beta-induced protein